MKELLLEFIKGNNQVEEFKTWLIDSGVEVDEGVEAWVDFELENID